MFILSIGGTTNGTRIERGIRSCDPVFGGSSLGQISH